MRKIVAPGNRAPPARLLRSSDGWCRAKAATNRSCGPTTRVRGLPQKHTENRINVETQLNKLTTELMTEAGRGELWEAINWTMDPERKRKKMIYMQNWSYFTQKYKLNCIFFELEWISTNKHPFGLVSSLSSDHTEVWGWKLKNTF